MAASLQLHNSSFAATWSLTPKHDPTLDAELVALACGADGQPGPIQATVARDGLVVADTDLEGAALQRRAVEHDRQAVRCRDLRLEGHLPRRNLGALRISECQARSVALLMQSLLVPGCTTLSACCLKMLCACRPRSLVHLAPPSSLGHLQHRHRHFRSRCRPARTGTLKGEFQQTVRLAGSPRRCRRRGPSRWPGTAPCAPPTRCPPRWP